MKSKFIYILLFSILFSTSSYFPHVQANDDKEIVIINALPDINFNSPVDIQSTNSTPNLLYIVEQDGKIFSIDITDLSLGKNLILDITSKVDSSGSEMGLLGLAFHPKFGENGFFFVDYTTSDPRRTVISRFHINDDGIADPSSELIILEIQQPYSNHNAGQITFGPDGMFYITLGDGGSSGDPQDNGQDPSTLLGSILRINVDQEGENKKYRIPENNPFYNNTDGYREEIYAYGLRNPWRMSFDKFTGNLYTGDVGQNNYEEVNLILKGKNYGWNIMEGYHCFLEDNCDKTGLEMPLLEYNHSLGNAITGGYVYRGTNLTEMSNLYFFADYGSGRIWTSNFNDLNNVTFSLLFDTSHLISTFGIDTQNELYFADLRGQIYRFIQIPENSFTSIQNTGSTNTKTETNHINLSSTSNLIFQNSFYFIILIFPISFIKKKRNSVSTLFKFGKSNYNGV